MRTRLKEVQGLDWYDGAVMNCKWEGPRVRDVLLQAGVDEGVRQWREEKTGTKAAGDVRDEEDGGKVQAEAEGGDRSDLYHGLHVQFACDLVPTQEDSWYGGSIDLTRAMDPEMDVILALKVCGSHLSIPSTHNYHA